MVTHDPHTGTAWLGSLGQPSSFFHPDLKRPLSQWEWSIATGNALFAVASFGVFFFWVLRERGAALRAPDPDRGSPPSSGR